MDEILASIRRIIADDQEPQKAAEAIPAEDEAEPTVEAERPPTVILASPDDIQDRSFAPMPEPEEPVPGPKLAQVVAASPVRPQPARRTEPAEPERDSDLVSNEAMASVNHAFNMLSHTVLSQNARTLEDLVTDMLKPMLKTWLDDNLPSMVERLVRAEIERVARGGR